MAACRFTNTAARNAATRKTTCRRSPRSRSPSVPACGKKAYKKLLSAAGFQLKGSGWYATDFKTTGKKPAEKKATKSIEDRDQDGLEDRIETGNQESGHAGRDRLT